MLDEIQSDLSRSVPKESATNFIGDLHTNACHLAIMNRQKFVIISKNQQKLEAKVFVKLLVIKCTQINHYKRLPICFF
jgi:hypothetical protein